MTVTAVATSFNLHDRGWDLTRTYTLRLGSEITVRIGHRFEPDGNGALATVHYRDTLDPEATAIELEQVTIRHPLPVYTLTEAQDQFAGLLAHWETTLINRFDPASVNSWPSRPDATAALVSFDDAAAALTAAVSAVRTTAAPDDRDDLLRTVRANTYRLATTAAEAAPDRATATAITDAADRLAEAIHIALP